MPWVRLDDGFDDDPRVVTAGIDATGLLVCCLCWSNRTLADGFVPTRVIEQKAGASFGPEVIETLVSVGLLTRCKVGALDGYRIHEDLTKNQPTRAKVEADRADARRRKDEWVERHRHERRTEEDRDRNATGTREVRRSIRRTNADGT
jgi:hypothetical protein